jgi:hypothetical protein
VRGRTLEPGDPVIGYGTFPFARQIQLHSGWVPGAWCNPDQLDCAVYYPLLNQFLLNHNHTILPAADANDQVDALFARFSIDGRLFVRPTDCGKSFVGRCVDRDSFAAALGTIRHDATARVVVAAPVSIGREWRLLVCRDTMVAATQYADRGARNVQTGCPPEVRSFVVDVLTAVGWRPDPVFFLDVGEAAGRLAVVEVSGFSCSWMYGCDVRAVVEAVSSAALTACAPSPSPLTSADRPPSE